MLSKRKERLFPRSDMAQEGSQARVRRGGDSIINEPVWSMGSITVHRVKKTVFKLNLKTLSSMYTAAHVLLVSQTSGIGL